VPKVHIDLTSKNWYLKSSAILGGFMPQIVDQLLNTSLGQAMSATDAAELVQQSRERSISRGESLFSAGDQGDALYVIVDGSFDIKIGSNSSSTVVANVGAGQIVGEVEVMTKSLRVASLIAADDAQVLEVGAKQFNSMLESNKPVATKLLTSIAQTLARRLAAVNQQLITKTNAEKPPEPEKVEEPVEIGDEDLIMEVQDDDLDVLDKLWG